MNYIVYPLTGLLWVITASGFVEQGMGGENWTYEKPRWVLLLCVLLYILYCSINKFYSFFFGLQIVFPSVFTVSILLSNHQRIGGKRVIVSSSRPCTLTVYWQKLWVFSSLFVPFTFEGSWICQLNLRIDYHMHCKLLFALAFPTV